MSIDVSAILYSAINEIGRDKIRQDITSNIGLAETYCEQIMNSCRSKLGEDMNVETVTACEGLLHFMLTASLLPSQRKLTVRGKEIDVVIPSLRALGKDPEKSVVIQVIKRDADFDEKIAHAEQMQPVKANIWLISYGRLSTEYKNYHLGADDNDSSHSATYSKIIKDIHSFVTSRGITGLRLMQ